MLGNFNFVIQCKNSKIYYKNHNNNTRIRYSLDIVDNSVLQLR